MPMEYIIILSGLEFHFFLGIEFNYEWRGVEIFRRNKSITKYVCYENIYFHE